MHNHFSAPSTPSRLPSYIAQPFFGQHSKPAIPSLPAIRPQEDTAPGMLSRDISSRFGLRLRELRRERNMTQLRMAVDFGIDRSFISDVERGRKSISLTLLEVIALGMKLELSDLVRGL